MATIKSPYTKQLSSMSPQRSAGIGRPAVLPQEYALGYHAAEPTTVTKPPKTLDEMLYAVPQTEDLMPYQIGPGPGGDLGQAQGMPNSVEAGVLSQGQADAIEGTVANMLGFHKGETGYQPSVLGLLGIPTGLANPATKGLIALGKTANDQLGDPLGEAGAFLGDVIGNISPTIANALGVGHAMSTGMEGGIPAAQGFNLGDTHGGWGKGTAVDSNMGPPSSLADIGIGSGGGGYDGGGYGMPGSEGVGGLW